MNIIFLDVDGVLNSIKHLKEEYYKNQRPYSGFEYPFDSDCMNNLKILVESTNAYLVITSTWRKFDIGKKILLFELKKYDLDKKVIGYTNILNTKRGEEIKDFLSKLSCDVNYIILDDDSDFDDLHKYLIKTDYRYGLTYNNVETAIKKLNKVK